MSSDLKPFANETQALSIGDLSVENCVDRVSLFGSLDLTRDKTGLERARALKALLDATVAALEADPDLPAELPPPDAPTGPRDPFA
ncbi:hypothetical protein [Azospirillum sp. sgz302134]